MNLYLIAALFEFVALLMTAVGSRILAICDEVKGNTGAVLAWAILGLINGAAGIFVAVSGVIILYYWSVQNLGPSAGLGVFLFAAAAGTGLYFLIRRLVTAKSTN